MTTRSLAWVAIAALAATGSATTAFGGKWLNQVGRYFGYGYSDGYHAAKTPPAGDSILTEHGRGEAIPTPAAAPAAPPKVSSGPIEPRPELMPKAPKFMGFPSRMMTPSPSTTGDAAPPIRTRVPARAQGAGGALSRLKAKDRKPGEENTNDGLPTPKIEGPSVVVEGPSLAPAATPTADGSIDPYPEAPPAAAAPVAEPGPQPGAGGPSTSRQRYILPPR